MHTINIAIMMKYTDGVGIIKSVGINYLSLFLLPGIRNIMAAITATTTIPITIIVNCGGKLNNSNGDDIIINYSPIFSALTVLTSVIIKIIIQSIIPVTTHISAKLNTGHENLSLI